MVLKVVYQPEDDNSNRHGSIRLNLSPNEEKIVLRLTYIYLFISLTKWDVTSKAM
jgi:hypothetical protein